MMWEIAALVAAQSVPVLPGSPGVPPMPWTQTQICEGTERPPGSKGLLDVRLDEPVAAALARSTYRFDPDRVVMGVYGTGERLDLRFRHGSRTIDLPGIGGMHNIALSVHAFDGPISSLSFWYQDRPLRLEEALARAWTLRLWFAEARFRPVRRARIGPAPSGTRALSPMDGPGDFSTERDRAAAEAMLRDPANAIPEMTLFRLASGDHEVTVTIENWDRLTRLVTRGSRSIFAACGGREWGLKVEIQSSTAYRAAMRRPRH